MLKDWLDTLPVTTRRPDPQQTERRRERFYRDLGQYVVFSWEAQLGYLALMGLVWLAKSIWHVEAARLPILITGGLILFGVLARIFFVALRPEPRRHS